MKPNPTEFIIEAQEQNYTERELIEFVNMEMLGAKALAYRLYRDIGKNTQPFHMYRLKLVQDMLDQANQMMHQLTITAGHEGEGTGWRLGNYAGHGECQNCLSHAHLYLIHKYDNTVTHAWEEGLWDGTEWGHHTPDGHAALCKNCYIELMPADGWCECGCGG